MAQVQMPEQTVARVNKSTPPGSQGELVRQGKWRRKNNSIVAKNDSIVAEMRKEIVWESVSKDRIYPTIRRTTRHIYLDKNEISWYQTRQETL